MALIHKRSSMSLMIILWSLLWTACEQGTLDTPVTDQGLIPQMNVQESTNAQSPEGLLGNTSTSCANNRLPVARIARPSQAMAHQAVSLNAGASYDPDGTPLRYQFNFGDGVQSPWQTSSTITHAYPSGGTFYVTLSVHDACGSPTSQVRTAMTAVIVAGAAAPTATPSASPPPASSDLSLAHGLNAWRQPDAKGMACANCHAPDGFDLAYGGFSDANIRRRGSFHLPADQVEKIVTMIHGVRRKYNLPARDPMEFRPFQPGGSVLPGNTPQERDLAFGQALRNMNFLLASDNINSLAKAKAARDQILNLKLRKVRIGIPFNRWAEDRFHGAEHDTTAEWLPNVPHVPKAGVAYATYWYGLHDQYISDPTDQRFRALYDRISELTTNWQYVYQENPIRTLMKRKYQSTLLAQHLLRREVLGGIRFEDGNAPVLPENPVWGVGKMTHDFDWAWLWLNVPINREMTPTYFHKDFEKYRLPWLWLGWLFDPTLHTSPLPRPDFQAFCEGDMMGCDGDGWGDLMRKSKEEMGATLYAGALFQWLWVPELESPNSGYQRPTGYPLHATFAAANKIIRTVHQLPQFQRWGMLDTQALNLNDFATSIRFDRSRPHMDYVFHEGFSSEHQAFYAKMTANMYRMFLYLLEEAITEKLGTANSTQDFRAVVTKLVPIYDFLTFVEPDQCNAYRNRFTHIAYTLVPNLAQNPFPVCVPSTPPAMDFSAFVPVEGPYAPDFLNKKGMFRFLPSFTDLDGDQDPDLILQINDSGYPYRPVEALGIWRNQNGQFLPSGFRHLPISSTGPAKFTGGAFFNDQRFTFGDFNRDGRTDIVFNLGTGLYVVLNTADGFFSNRTYLLQNSIRAFSQSAAYTDPNEAIHRVVVADMNGDFYDDLVIKIGQRLIVLINRGPGTSPMFEAQPAVVASLNMMGAFQDLKVGDFNRDGRKDVVVVSAPLLKIHDDVYRIEESINIAYLYNNGRNNLLNSFESATPVAGWNPFHRQIFDLHVADVTGDGFVDFITGDLLEGIRIHIGDSRGMLTQNIPFALNAKIFPVMRPNMAIDLGYGTIDGFRVTAADINSDGRLDLVIRNEVKAGYKDGANYDINNFIVLLNQGNGLSWKPVFYDLDNRLGTIDRHRGIAVADVNGDGIGDVVQTYYPLVPESHFTSPLGIVYGIRR